MEPTRQCTKVQDGDINDKVGDVDGNSEGYHAYYLAEFPEINTDSVKVILKAGFLGEPSLYEVTPLCAGVPADKAGDAAELESMIGLQRKQTVHQTIM